MKYVFGNWKDYLGFYESVELAHQLLDNGIGNIQNINVALFPTAIAISEVKKIFDGSSVSIGAQDCAYTPQGAYTGATSADSLKNTGCEYVICGHSERRHIFGETDAEIQKKIRAAVGAGLVPVVCIGETNEEKHAGKRETRLKEQMKVLEGIDMKSAKITFAYEPVWATGTGKPCEPSDVNSIHRWIRTELIQYTNVHVPILYGGSVDANKVASYLSQDAVDGVLVGKASTEAYSFLSILHAARSIS